MTFLAIVNAHLAVGIAALLVVLSAAACEEKAPHLGRKICLGGLVIMCLMFVAALFQIEFQSPIGTREIVVRQSAIDGAVPRTTSSAPLPNAVVLGSFRALENPKAPETNWGSLGLFAYLAFIGCRLLIAVAKLRRIQFVARSFQFVAHFRGIPFGMADVQTPCVFGIREPRIVVPADFGRLPSDQQVAVLLHESAHVTKRHTTDLVVREMLRIPLGWFGPVRLLFASHDRAMEAECDIASAEELGDGISLARALVHFSSCSRQPAWCGLALVNAGTSLERRIHRLLSERKTMNINILTQITIATAVLGGAAIASQSFQLKNAGEVPAAAKAAATLANLEVGRQWTYEYSWPGVESHRFVLHASKAIPVADGVVYELKKFSTSLKGTPMNSYSYMRINQDGVGDTPNANISDSTPGFALTSQGPQIPSNFVPGKKWSWSAIGGVNAGGPASPSLFTGEVLPSRSIDTPIGKRTATVIAITEKVQWDVSTRVSFYVAGLGKVREELHRNDKIVQLLQLKQYQPAAPAPAEPQYIETKPGR